MQIFIYCRVTLHVSGVTAPIISSTKTVTALSGTGHNTGAATSLQRGLIGTSKTFFTKWRLYSDTILKTEIMMRQPTGEREM